MEELIIAIHNCAAMLHDLHIAVTDVPVHKLFDEWYRHALDDYDNFVEWARILDIDTEHDIHVYGMLDMTIEEAYAKAKQVISSMLVAAVGCMPKKDTIIDCGIRSDIENLCSYWSKVSLYMMR